MTVRITTYPVHDGLIDLRSEELEEGSLVTVAIPERGQAYELTAQEEADLAAALDEADRGETVDDSQVRQLIGQA